MCIIDQSAEFRNFAYKKYFLLNLHVVEHSVPYHQYHTIALIYSHKRQQCSLNYKSQKIVTK